jgi:oligo-1,6-glucosidase/alpha-glucosidase
MAEVSADTVKIPDYPSVYQIYPRSFCDSNGDGIGDIPGIISKLDYIRSLGFDGIWCSPFFSSPQQDFGYDISDYKNIAPEYGTREDAIRLMDEVHRRGMFILLDLVMNHTSVEHPWFKASASGKNNEYSDWYIWRDKPNNWMSLTGGSGWHYQPERKQYYYASFLPFQPDLNYRNPEVKKHMLEIARYWLDLGADGFRLDIFNVIYKDASFRSNPFAFKAVPDENDPSGFFQKFKYTINQPESVEFARELRTTCDLEGTHPILLGEVSGSMDTIRKYLGDGRNGLSHVFVFHMLPFRFKASWFAELLEEMERVFPVPYQPVYVFSNHDRRRSMARLGNDLRKAKLLHSLQFLVRGCPVMYYGEELGLGEVKLPRKTALDPIAQKFRMVPKSFDKLLGETLNRDEARLPMPWNDRISGGFSSSAKTWLPLVPEYRNQNVMAAETDAQSLLHYVRELNAMRNRWQVLRSGSMDLSREKNLLIINRRNESGEHFRIYLNFGNKPTTVAVGDGIMLLASSDKIIYEQQSKLFLTEYGCAVFKMK